MHSQLSWVDPWVSGEWRGNPRYISQSDHPLISGLARRKRNRHSSRSVQTGFTLDYLPFTITTTTKSYILQQCHAYQAHHHPLYPPSYLHHPSQSLNATERDERQSTRLKFCMMRVGEIGKSKSRQYSFRSLLRIDVNQREGTDDQEIPDVMERVSCRKQGH